MGFQKNHPKYGGTGSNKLTLRQLKMNVRALLEDLEFSAIHELTKLYKRRDTPLDIKVRILESITRYSCPRFSNIQLSGEMKHSVSSLVIQRIMADPIRAKMAEDLCLSMLEEENKLQIEGPPREIEAGESNPLADAEDTPTAEPFPDSEEI